MKFQVTITDDIWPKIRDRKEKDELTLEEILIESLGVVAQGTSSALIRALNKVRVALPADGVGFLVDIHDGLWRSIMANGTFEKDEKALEGILKVALHTASAGAVSTAIMDAVRKISVSKYP